MRRHARRREVRRDRGIFLEGERAAEGEDVAVDAGAPTNRGVRTEQDEAAADAPAHDRLSAADQDEAPAQFTF